MTTSENTTAARTYSRRDFLQGMLALPLIVGAAAILPEEAEALGKPGKTAIVGWAPHSRAITLRWKKVSGAKSYEIKVYTDNKFGRCVKTVKTKGTSAAVKGLGSAMFYCVRVRACNKAGKGAWSAPKIMRTKINPTWPSTSDGCYASGETLGYSTIVLRYLIAAGKPHAYSLSLRGKDGSVCITTPSGATKYYVVDFDKGSVYTGKFVNDPMTGGWVRRGKLLCK